MDKIIVIKGAKKEESSSLGDSSLESLVRFFCIIGLFDSCWFFSRYSNLVIVI
ncbi:hypothetical protein SAMN04489868_11073 [Pisciglobus halotolerans]|uniref:Uncharacterized protein n=1 Tax=Pisciglobus halotolerans TaxID=745365 RepID=A0A1I3BYW1_9LACT|nr:hypothetical protein SAMN04489868_11073 [Pisciglobus halotolerans]